MKPAAIPKAIFAPAKKKADVKLQNVSGPVKSGKNPAQYIDKGKNGSPYIFVKLTQTEFAWSNKAQYWRKHNMPNSLLGQDVWHLNKVFFLNPSAQFYEIPKNNYFLLLRHNACRNVGLNACKLTVKVDGKEVYSSNFIKKDYKKVKNKNGLYDELIMNIRGDMFNIANTHEVYVEITGDKNLKKEWELDGFILLPDNCDGKIGNIYHQYFDNELLI